MFRKESIMFPVPLFRRWRNINSPFRNMMPSDEMKKAIPLLKIQKKVVSLQREEELKS